jgi:hypothetical protein
MRQDKTSAHGWRHGFDGRAAGLRWAAWASGDCEFSRAVAQCGSSWQGFECLSSRRGTRHSLPCWTGACPRCSKTHAAQYALAQHRARRHLHHPRGYSATACAAHSRSSSCSPPRGWSCGSARLSTLSRRRRQPLAKRTLHHSLGDQKDPRATPGRKSRWPKEAKAMAAEGSTEVGAASMTRGTLLTTRIRTTWRRMKMRRVQTRRTPARRLRTRRSVLTAARAARSRLFGRRQWSLA